MYKIKYHISGYNWTHSFDKYYRLCMSFGKGYSKYRSKRIFTERCHHCMEYRIHKTGCEGCFIGQELGPCMHKDSTWAELLGIMSKKRVNKQLALTLSQQILKVIWDDGESLDYPEMLSNTANEYYNKYHEAMLIGKI